MDLNAFCSATAIGRCKGELQAHIGLNFSLHIAGKAAFLEDVTAQTFNV